MPPYCISVCTRRVGPSSKRFLLELNVTWIAFTFTFKVDLLALMLRRMVEDVAAAYCTESEG